MRETQTTQEDKNRPELYEIRLKGHLEARWSAWFEGMTITQEDNGITLLAGPLPDQSALHGLLKKIRDLGMPLLSVNCVEPSPPDDPTP